MKELSIRLTNELVGCQLIYHTLLPSWRKMLKLFASDWLNHNAHLLETLRLLDKLGELTDGFSPKL
jgi:hypothetical protein